MGFRCCRGDDPTSLCDTQLASGSYTFEGSPCNSTGWSFTTAGRWAIGADTNPAPYQGSCELGLALGSNYGNSWNEYATSPLINLGGCTSQTVTMHWRMWYQIESTTYDYLYLQAYNGSSWVNVAGPYGSQIGAGSWAAYSADVSAQMNANFRFRFYFHSDISVAYRGAYIDNITFETN